MYFHRALTWSSDVSDGVGVTDMATAAVGIAEKDYHKVVVCSPTSVLLWFGAGFCKFKMLIRVTALRSKSTQGHLSGVKNWWREMKICYDSVLWQAIC